ncbi:hypothetical protein [Ferrovum sp.]|uniref:hypothetical protein n=1 Tax=Ferrovum sp. TaxID=2609467 RepID=UPI002632302F|nr:hypothetical protein [Ferrovum sp.]
MTGRSNIKGLPRQDSGLDGKDLFSQGTFDGNGTFCESCSRNGGGETGRMTVVDAAGDVLKVV